MFLVGVEARRVVFRSMKRVYPVTSRQLLVKGQVVTSGSEDGNAEDTFVMGFRRDLHLIEAYSGAMP